MVVNLLFVLINFSGFFVLMYWFCWFFRPFLYYSINTFGCSPIVSPCEMKIIMYEGNKKFAMRGENRVQLSKTEFFGGNYKFDKAFELSINEIKDFAKYMWKRNVNQEWK